MNIKTYQIKMSLFETPYIRDPLPLNYIQKYGVPESYANYTDFDLFRLERNLNPYLDELRPLIPFIEQHDSEYLVPPDQRTHAHPDRMRYFVRITDSEGNDPDLLPEERASIENAIALVTSSFEKNAIFVMSYSPELVSGKGFPIPPAWVIQMLPFAPYSEKYKPIYHTYRGVYLRIESDNKDYEGIYGRFTEQLIIWLQTRYDKGYLPIILSDKFVEDWNLVSINGLLWKPKSVSPSVMGHDWVEFYTQRVQPFEGQHFWWTPPMHDLIEQHVAAQVFRENKVEFMWDQFRFKVLVQHYMQAKALMASIKSRLFMQNQTGVITIQQIQCRENMASQKGICYKQHSPIYPYIQSVVD